MSMVPVAVLSITLGTTAQASTITVETGDTLWDLARANHTTVENLQKFNHLTTDLIHPGDVLTVVTEKQYTVKKGDTLWDIARAHQVNVSQIKEWNQLQTDLIQPGSKLVIFEGLKANPTTGTTKPVKSAPSNSKESTSNVTVSSTNKAATKPTKKVEAKATAPATNHAEPKPAAPATNHAQPKPAAPATNHAQPKPAAPVTNNADVKEIIVEATAYTASCEGCSGITSTGINLKENPDAKVISVDPNVIPLGSKVYVEGYGEAIAGDTGGSIKGKRIDVFVPTKEEAIQFGVKQVKVKILD